MWAQFSLFISPVHLPPHSWRGMQGRKNVKHGRLETTLLHTLSTLSTHLHQVCSAREKIAPKNRQHVRHLARERERRWFETYCIPGRPTVCWSNSGLTANMCPYNLRHMSPNSASFRRISPPHRKIVQNLKKFGKRSNILKKVLLYPSYFFFTESAPHRTSEKWFPNWFFNRGHKSKANEKETLDINAFKAGCFAMPMTIWG